MYIVKFFISGPIIIQSKKSKQVVYNGNTYRRCTKSKKGIIWKCTSSKSDDCKVTITTDDLKGVLSVVLKKGSHNHKNNMPVSKEKPKHIYFTTD